MASNVFPASHSLLIHQHSKRLLVKDCLPCVKSSEGSEDVNSAKFMSLCSNFPPRVMDDNNTQLELVDLSVSIAESYRRNEKVKELLKSESADLQKGKLDLASLLGLSHVHLTPWNPHMSYTSHLPDRHQNSCQLLDFVGDIGVSSEIFFLPDGRVFFGGNAMEFKDFISIVAEVYNAKNLERRKANSFLVPSPYRFNESGYIKEDLPDPEAEFLPLSPEKTKAKSHPRKSIRRAAISEKNAHKRSYFHACESLLSLMISAKDPCSKTAILSLARSSAGIPALLTQISACIAGAGLAVLFFVACRSVSSESAFSASEVVNGGLGLGLMWLSSGVNKLRDAIVHVSRSSDSDENVNVGKILKKIYFRAAVLLTLAVLKIG